MEDSKEMMDDKGNDEEKGEENAESVSKRIRMTVEELENLPKEKETAQKREEEEKDIEDMNAEELRILLKTVQKRAKAAQKCAEGALQRAEAAQKCADAALQRADAALKREDAVLQRADAALQREDAALQRADAAQKRADAALQREDAALQRADAAQKRAVAEGKEWESFKIKNLQASILCFFNTDYFRFPSISRQGTLHDAVISNSYAAVKMFEEKNFSPLTSIEVGKIKAKTSALLSRGQDQSYFSEADVVTCCNSYIWDIVKACDLEEFLSVNRETNIFSCKPDICVINYMEVPIGAFEVKKPTVDLMNNVLLMGRLFDYMMMVRSFSGLKCVFGVITDFNTWRICWFPDCDAAATSDVLIDLDTLTMDPNTGTNRKLHVSKIYTGGGGTAENVYELSIAMMSLLLKMDHSFKGRESVQLVSENRPYIKLTNDQFHYQSGLQYALNFSFPDEVSEFILLRDYHGGRDGRVWLTCTVSGNLCVLKFPNTGDVEKAELEAENWRTMGFQNVRVCTLNKKAAIVMPFAFNFNDDGKIVADLDTWSLAGYGTAIEGWEDVSRFLETVDFNNALGHCITAFAERKLCHNDIEARHVAIVYVPEAVSVLERKFIYTFIDLSDVTKYESEEEAVDKMDMKARQITARLSQL